MISSARMISSAQMISFAAIPPGDSTPPPRGAPRGDSAGIYYVRGGRGHGTRRKKFFEKKFGHACLRGGARFHTENAQICAGKFCFGTDRGRLG